MTPYRDGFAAAYQRFESRRRQVRDKARDIGTLETLSAAKYDQFCRLQRSIEREPADLAALIAAEADLDAYLLVYNTKRPHQGRAMNGRTPQRVFKDGLPKTENAKMKPKTKAA